MKIVERAVRAVDGLQQRNHLLGLVFGVIKKFGDDGGSSLAVTLTYYGFMSLFPLLLVFTTILGFIGNETLSKNVVGTTLEQFPVFGEQIGKSAAHPLTGSGAALVIGLVVLLYGALGVAQAAQHTMAQVWNVPGVGRPGYFPRLGRGLMFFAGLGLGMAVTALASGLITGSGHEVSVRVVAFVVLMLLDVAMYLGAFRVLTPRSIPTGSLVVGAMLAGVGYALLLAVGTSLVQHQLRHTQALYGQFALVLGLMGWLFLVSQLTVYAAETNVVVARHLWPRSLVQPPLTPADQRVLRYIAYQEQRRPEERVGVSFESDNGAESPDNAG